LDVFAENSDRGIICYHNVIVFEKHFSGLKSVFEKLGFRYGLVWTVEGLAVELKLWRRLDGA